jgi:hypothetical protein
VKAEARTAGAGALIFWLTLGCQASLNADANLSADGEGRGAASADGELQGEGELSRSPQSRTGSSSPSGSESALADAELLPSRVLLGARHDLKLQSGKATASCRCLAVALGGARSSGMLWTAAPPAIDETTQLAIALSSDGVECQGEPKGSLGASYWGYRVAGNDVIVLVEAARGGRPLTTGAVIPKPVGPGQVIVAPTSKNLPYGRALAGQGSCTVGNPGPLRTVGFSQLEQGVDAVVAKGAAGARADASNDTPTTIELPSN